MSHSLALITVVYENYTVLKDFFKSLKSQTNNSFHVFVVDLSKHKKNIKNVHQATVIPDLNKGYAYGVNIGLREAVKNGLQYFCILNNDVYFNQDFVQKCFNSILNHPSSIIGGKIYNAPGYEYHKDRYKKADLGKVIWYAGGRIDWDHALTPHIGVDEVDRGQFNKFKEIDFINGALMLYDMHVHERVGLWDESYFLYFEDADFCLRAKKAGIKLYYDPSIVIWHKNAQSTEGVGSALQQKYQQVGRLKFGLKYAPLKTKFHLLKNYVFSKF